MNDEEAIEKVDKCFKLILNAKSKEDIEGIFNNPFFKRDKNPKCLKKPNREKYPHINFLITLQEIEELVHKGYLNNDYTLSNKLAEGNSPLSSLEKLLYSLAWKNGELKSVVRIIIGILGHQNDKKDVVFYYFGKALANPRKPIIDQHVIRAYRLYERNAINGNISDIRRQDTIDTDYQNCIDGYITWITGDFLTEELRSIPNYIKYVDDVLFALGKYVKVN